MRDKALSRLMTMGDWLQMKTKINTKKLIEEIKPFENDWKPYNLRNPNNRFGLSITSLDGRLSGIPDLDSLLQWNDIHDTNITNHDIKTFTPVYDNSPELQRILEPWKPWLGRCHFLKMNKGGYFPEHYDINKTEYGYDEIRFAGFLNNCNKSNFKFIYEDTVQNVRDGELWYFNANKRHTVFSTTDDAIMIVFCLKFDEHLFEKLIEEYVFA
jgi:hypothetical protein